MPYFANLELEGHRLQQEAYETHHKNWLESEPKPPEKPRPHTIEEIDEQQVVESPDGPMIVGGQSVLVTDADGNTFAMPRGKFDREYTEMDDAP